MAKTVFLSNPAKRKAPKRRKTTAKRVSTTKRKTTAKRRRPSKARASTAARLLRRRRRNPAKRGIVDSTIMPAAKGAAGAIAIDMVYNLIPIPAEYQSGMVGSLVKMVGVIGIGMAAEKSKIVKPATSRDAVNGALTVQIYNLGQELVGSVMAGSLSPAPADGGTGYIATAQNAGELGLGYVSPATGFNGTPGNTMGMFNEFEESETYAY